MKIKAIGNNVVIKEVQATETTASGIVLSASIEHSKAEVLSVGSRVSEVQVGDTVLVEWNKVKTIKGQKDVVVVDIKDVICVFEKQGD